jgi:hypothetical protein
LIDDWITVHHILLIWLRISVIWYDSPSLQASRPSLDHLYPFGTAPNPQRSPNAYIHALHMLSSGPLPGSPRMCSSGFAPIISRALPGSLRMSLPLLFPGPLLGSPRVFIRLCTYYFQGTSWAVPESRPSNCALHILFPGPSSAVPEPLSFFFLLVRFTPFLGLFY